MVITKVFGPEHPNVATSLNNLAALYKSLEEYTKAKPLHKRALAIREKVFGPEHPDVANSLNSLAELYLSLEEYQEAKPLVERLLAIREKALGPGHLDVATSLNDLSEIHSHFGEYTKAKPLIQRALAIREEDLGSENLDVATCLSNLANVYKSIKDYTKAKPLYERALAIREKNLEPDHLDVIDSLKNLANLYMSIGDFTNAESLYKRIHAIREAAIEESGEMAELLIEKAEIGLEKVKNRAQEGRHILDPAEEKRFFEDVLDPAEKILSGLINNTNVFADEFADMIEMLTLPSAMDSNMREGKIKKNVSSLEEYVKAVMACLGPQDIGLAKSLDNLGFLYSSVGDYAKSDSSFKRALVIKEKALGPGERPTRP